MPITDATICTNPSINSSFIDHAEPNSTSTFEKFWSEKTVPSYLIVMILPILNLRNDAIFTKFNSLGTVSVMYITILTITKALMWGINWSSDPLSTHFVELWNINFPSLMGMLCLAYFIHSAIITLLKNNEIQENNHRGKFF